MNAPSSSAATASDRQQNRSDMNDPDGRQQAADQGRASPRLIRCDPLLCAAAVPLGLYVLLKAWMQRSEGLAGDGVPNGWLTRGGKKKKKKISPPEISKAPPPFSCNVFFLAQMIVGLAVLLPWAQAAGDPRPSPAQADDLAGCWLVDAFLGLFSLGRSAWNFFFFFFINLFFFIFLLFFFFFLFIIFFFLFFLFFIILLIFFYNIFCFYYYFFLFFILIIFFFFFFF